MNVIPYCSFFSLWITGASSVVALEFRNLVEFPRFLPRDGHAPPSVITQTLKKQIHTIRTKKVYGRLTFLEKTNFSIFVFRLFETSSG
jgi:hypothetical protein